MNVTQLVTLAASVLTAGWVSAYLVQIIKRETWPSSVKLILALVMAAIVGVATAWLTGDLTRFVDLWNKGMTSEQVLSFAALVYASSATWYRFYFKDAEWAQNVGKWGSGGK
jgi:hypothetical protein